MHSVRFELTKMILVGTRIIINLSSPVYYMILIIKPIKVLLKYFSYFEV